MSQSMSGIATITDGMATLEDGDLTCNAIFCESIQSSDVVSSGPVAGINLNATNNASCGESVAVGAHLVVGKNIVNSGGVFTNSVQCTGITLSGALGLTLNATQSATGMQWGTATASDAGEVTVYFANAFLNTPVVTCTVVYADATYLTSNVFITSTTKTQFTYVFNIAAGGHSEHLVRVNWFAVC